MRMISPTKTATVFAALVALLYAFPANAAAPALTRIQLALWVDIVFLTAYVVVFITGIVIRNRDRGSRDVDANPADRNIVRTCVAIMLICVAVAWAAVVATAVHQLNLTQPVLAALSEAVSVISVTVPMTIVALYWSIPNSRLQRHRTLMIIGMVVVALGLAASLLTAYARIAPLQAIALRSALLYLG
jgi:hypothetical protein